MALEQEHIHHSNLIHISVPLELLPHLRSESRNRHVEGVHGLNLWSLSQPN
jgi:hypothetical protein